MNINLDRYDLTAIAKGIAENVREKRLNKNYSQEKLARKSGVSLGSIKRFERSYEISLKHLLKIALVFDAQDDFSQLFKTDDYQSLDEIIQNQKKKERKRGRDV